MEQRAGDQMKLKGRKSLSSVSADEWNAIRGSMSDHIASLPPRANGLVRVAADGPRSEMVAAMARDGGVIVECAISEQVADAVAAQLAPYIHNTQMGGNDGGDFTGGRTKRTGMCVWLCVWLCAWLCVWLCLRARVWCVIVIISHTYENSNIGYCGLAFVGAVVARSPKSWPLIMHPAIMDICEAVLGQQLACPTKVPSAEVLSSQITRWSDTTATSYPWQLNLTQCIHLEPGAPGNHSE